MPTDGALGPVLALAAIALLTAVLRLLIGRAGTRPPEEDFGLLRVAAVADDRAGADVVRGLLARAGIRATVAAEADHRVRVLVFTDDLEQARAVVSGPA